MVSVGLMLAGWGSYSKSLSALGKECQEVMIWCQLKEVCAVGRQMFRAFRKSAPLTLGFGLLCNIIFLNRSL